MVIGRDTYIQPEHRTGRRLLYDQVLSSYKTSRHPDLPKLEGREAG